MQRSAPLVLLAALCGCDDVDGSVRKAPDARDASTRETDAGIDLGDGGAADRQQEIAAMWRDHPLWKSGTRLRANVEDGGGGAVRFGLFFTDTQLGVDCSPGLATDGELRCLPVNQRTVRYRDPECMQPALAVADTANAPCASSESVIQGDLYPSVACDASPSPPYQVLNRVPKQVVYDRVDGACVAGQAMDCLFELAPAPASLFVRGSTHTEAIDEELALTWIEYEDGARVAGRIRDWQHDIDCEPPPKRESDRCAPIAEGYVELREGEDALYFGDVGCQHPVAGSFPGICGKPAVVYALEPAECSDKTLYYDVTKELALAYRRSDARCEPGPSDSGWHFFELGAKLDPETFPLVMRARAGTERLKLDYLASPEGRPLQVEGFYDLNLETPCEGSLFEDGTTRCVPWRPGQNFTSDVLYADATCATGTEVVAVGASQCLRQPFALRIEGQSGLASVRRIGPIVDTPKQLFELRDKCVKATDRSGTDPIAFHSLAEELDLPRIEERLE